MSEELTVEVESPKRGKLLTVVSLFLAFGCISSLAMVPSEIVASFGMIYQITLVIAALITGASAFGIWQNQKWGAYTYTALTVVNQPLLLIMGWWNLGALIIPSIIVVILFTNLSTMK
ncbi:hypothetical protein Q9887_001191 [Vibrio fluvialis]|nr:hypothetical protein [Vibrio fluvialis]